MYYSFELVSFVLLGNRKAGKPRPPKRRRGRVVYVCYYPYVAVGRVSPAGARFFSLAVSPSLLTIGSVGAVRYFPTNWGVGLGDF